MITVGDAVKAVIQTLNIKEVSQLTISRIDAELRTIPSLENYIAYMEKNVDHANVDRKTGYQKFLKLNEMYKSKLAELIAKEELGTAVGKALTLSGKVRQVAPKFKETEYRINNLNHGIKSLHFRSFKGFFSEDEIRTLSLIGDLRKCIKIQDSVSGSDALCEKIEAIYKHIAIRTASGTPAVENKTTGQARVLSMAKQAVKA